MCRCFGYLRIDYFNNGKILLCIANTLLNIASTKAEPVVITVSDHPFSVPAQTSATNVAMARWAAVAASQVMQEEADLLEKGLSNQGQGTCGGERRGPDTDRARHARGRARLAELCRGLRHFSERRPTLPLVTCSPSRTRSVPHRPWPRRSGAELPVRTFHALPRRICFSAVIRAWAASTTWDESRAGLCSAPQLSAQAQRANEIFREAGVAPQDIAALPSSSEPITTNDLLDGNLPNGSVRQRLHALWGYDFDHPPAGVSAGQNNVADYFQLK